MAISNHRLLDITDQGVTFRWKDYAHHNKHRLMTLPHEEFLRRFLQHVLATGFPRIRYFGFLAHRRRTRLLPLCRRVLRASPPLVIVSPAAQSGHRCPRCQTPMRILERLSASELSREQHRPVALLDSS